MFGPRGGMTEILIRWVHTSCSDLLLCLIPLTCFHSIHFLEYYRRIWERLANCHNIIVLGGKAAPRLPIISVVIRHSYPMLSVDSEREQEPRCLFLHHNFVSALLNDLFGIQARGGCACAGPYAMDLLGIDEALAKLYEETLVGW